MPGVIWEVESFAGRLSLWALFWAGWALVLLSTFLIDHFDLFGMRQVHLYARGRAYRHLDFQISGLYRYVRHPLLLGFLITFWVTPLMTVGHLVFAAAMTTYILVAVQFEERDLARFHGEPYEDYRRRVPMLLPVPRLGKARAPEVSR
jgi:protein-S-isoprenylcysteine O-methyltransferase Ste14